MTACPVCGKPVDSLRAPAVTVRAGKVIGYCSKECSTLDASKPVAMPAAAAAAAAAAPAPAPAPKPAKRTPGSGVPKKMSDLDSAPVIEILHEPASGVVTSSADARTASGAMAARRSEADGAIQIADTGHIDDYVGFDDEPHRGRGLRVFVVLVLLLAVGAAAAYYFGYLDKYIGRGDAAVAEHKPEAAPQVVEPPPVDAAPAVVPADAVAHAKEVLRSQLKSDSPRVQRMAAIAFARTHDRDALALLGNALTKEGSEITKLDIAYALARAGDKRGIDALLAALVSPRRDVKGEAALRLAQLGDARAAATLDEFLEYSQFRLGAAEKLAYLADPRALEVLDKMRADPKTTPDDQARAVVALGIAGRADVAEPLRALLADPHFNAFAAVALANLHDAAARPVLVKQLAIPSLRVGAARALRRLDPKLDPVPLLPPLVSALASKDTEQVQVAEAILLLAGEASWSEHE